VPRAPLLAPRVRVLVPDLVPEPGPDPGKHRRMVPGADRPVRRCALARQWWPRTADGSCGSTPSKGGAGLASTTPRGARARAVESHHFAVRFLPGGWRSRDDAASLASGCAKRSLSRGDDPPAHWLSDVGHASGVRCRDCVARMRSIVREGGHRVWWKRRISDRRRRRYRRGRW
jgi:hypothetical protein